MRYNRKPLPPRINSSRNTSRTIVGSTLKYLPRPPHTPATIRSDELRYNLWLLTFTAPFHPRRGLCRPPAFHRELGDAGNDFVIRQSYHTCRNYQKRFGVDVGIGIHVDDVNPTTPGAQIDAGVIAAVHCPIGLPAHSPNLG